MKRFAEKGAFSLIEMVCVLALISLFMVILSMHLVGLTQIWLMKADDDFFEQHVDGVSLFLSNAIEASEPERGTRRRGPSLPVEWARPPGFDDRDDPLIHFRQATAPSLFVREGTALPHINAYLFFEEREGLSIIWYSDLESEEVEDESDLNITPISSFVSKVEYAYYDQEEDAWEIEDDPIEEENETFKLPHFLRLTFSHPEEDSIQRTILIPQRSEDAPLF